MHGQQADNKLVGHLPMVFLETTSQGYGIKDTGKRILLSLDPSQLERPAAEQPP